MWQFPLPPQIIGQRVLAPRIEMGDPDPQFSFPKPSSSGVGKPEVVLGGSINGFFLINGTGSIRASESVGFRFHTMDNGATVVDVVDVVDGYIKVPSVGGSAEVKLSVESVLINEDSGETEAWSDRQLIGSYSPASPQSLQYSISSAGVDLGLRFNRTANTNYALWHRYNFLLDAVNGMVEVQVTGRTFGPYALYLYD
jgi:hypothetical protein